MGGGPELAAGKTGDHRRPAKEKAKKLLTRVCPSNPPNTYIVPFWIVVVVVVVVNDDDVDYDDGGGDGDGGDISAKQAKMSASNQSHNVRKSQIIHLPIMWQRVEIAPMEALRLLVHWTLPRGTIH